MIDSLISALGLELGLTSHEIADVVWLALKMQESDRPQGVESNVVEVPEPLQQESARSASEQSSSRSESDDRAISDPEPKVGLHNSDSQQSSGITGGMIVKVPDARSLREPLSLARALKPLLRQVTMGWSPVLDEVATVERIVEEQLWLPVMMPSLEPWLELALVVDDSVSMQVWRRTVEEFQRILEHYGVFRDVRIWRMIARTGEVLIRPGIGKATQQLRRPSELIDPSGRRLIFVVTDCVAALWKDGTVQPTLKLWATNGPMAIVQMLPEWLWSRTGLGFASSVRLQSLLPGVPNQQLAIRDLSPWDEIDLLAGIRVPVVTLEPEPFGAWAQMMTGKGGAWATGVVFEPHEGNAGEIDFLLGGEMTAESRVQQFRVTASPMARQLAGLLAAAPVISLPVVRIIQERMLRESRQVHVAEVFLGGLLKPLVEILPETNVDRVPYEFLDGVRDILLESVATSTSINMLNEVSQFVAERLGLSMDSFTAVLRNPQDVENQDLVGELRPFAIVTAQILKKLGGEYAQFAEEWNIEATPQESIIDGDYIYEAKLIIIGEGGAGKTSLARKLINPQYKLTDGADETSTEDIDILKWKFKGRNGRDYCIHIWDFGGQEIYHQTHQFFLTKHSLYILIADTHLENIDFNYWLEIVELLTESSPTLIIKNEKQDRPCEINENQLRGRFPNLAKILSTNLATNRGLSEVLTAVQHHISQLLHIGEPLPATWVNVRKALETETRNHISQQEFLDLCDTHGFKRREDKLQLSRYLHDLGVCLHFQDDPILKNFILLKPEWGTTAVYKVLDTKTVRANLGCFTQTDLATIWADAQYADMRDEMLQLMKNFKLCYEIPHRPKTYIVPQLLSVKQPEYDWNNTDNIILRYHYDFMPKGMLTRFIVEMHKLIDSELVWKDGVILKDTNAQAEVIEARYRNEINIRISGKIKKSLLENIRYKFKKIHDSYERLKYQEYIPCNCHTCKGSQTPFSYSLNRLQERLKNDRYEIECDISYTMVEVRSLIDDVLSPKIGTTPIMTTQSTIFISYSHADAKWLPKLQTHLKPLIRNQTIEAWDDKKIRPGQKWKTEITQALNNATIAILLVSPNFLASDFIDKEELLPLLKAAEANGLTILWIPISASLVTETDLNDYQAAHNPSEPLDSLPIADQNRILIRICQEIKRIATAKNRE